MKISERELSAILEKIGSAVLVCRADLRICSCNSGAAVLLGYSREEIIGESFSDLQVQYLRLDGTFMPWNESPIAGVLSEFRPKMGRIVGIQSGSSGAVVWTKMDAQPEFEEDGTLGRIVISLTDVTRKLEDEAEKLRMSAAIEQTSEVVIITDRQGDIQYVNPAFTDKTGYSRREVIGRNPRILKSGEHDWEFYAGMWNTLLSGQVWNGQLINRKKDGDLFWEEAAISPVYGGDGQIRNFVAVKRDITKEKSLERQLRHAMKMEAIGTLAGGIAHDFNNILSVMIGYGQMAKGRLADDDPARGDIDQILMAGDRAVDLVKQILTFSRHDTNEQFKLVQVQHLIKEFLKLLRSSLPVTIELEYAIQEDCPPILADSSQIYQVLMNLCTNAKQAIGGGYGKITVNLKVIHACQEDDELANLLKNTGDHVDLEVSDNGCGMSPELQERIFEPFFTTKAKEHGTGLGLAVVHNIVKTHGGEIKVNSSVGRGTSFHVYFPVQEASVDVETEALEYEQKGSGRIMVVDDEKTIALMFERMLRKLGYNVTIFTDSIEAVSRFRKNPDEFDLVLTDMTMPMMTGAELAREILSLRPKLPVIMTTGFSEIIDGERAQRMGVREFLLKPVKKEKLSKVVKKVLGHG
jgi:PAS domain S-box-containing protein